MYHPIVIIPLLFMGAQALTTHNTVNGFSIPGSNSENVTLTWFIIDQMIKSATNFLPKPNLLKLYKLSKDLSLSADCESSLIQTMRGVRNTKEWAMHMIDASGKLPSGILDGTVMDFGSYEECLKIRVNHSSNEKEDFRGRYCMVGYSSPLFGHFNPNTTAGEKYVNDYGYPPEWIADEIIKAGGFLKRVAFWFGICMPSSCTEKDLDKLLSYVTKPLGMKVSIAGCEIDEPRKWPSYAFIAVLVLSIIAGLCVLGTTADIIMRLKHHNETEYFLLNFLKAFSFWTNTEKLLCNIPESGPLGCFHGIRFFSATWIILGHTYFFTDTWKYLKYRNLLGLQDIFNHYLPLAVIENFTIPVGSFFFMSGFLLVYSSWKKLQKNNGRLNLIMFFIHKYWRMTPALGLMIAMFMAMPIISSGPLWKSTLEPPIQACRKNWWTNILYINNWWNSDDFCIIHTWYLAALMQFHLVGVIVLLLTYRWPIFGAIMGFSITFGSCIYTSLLAAWNNFPMPAPAFIKDMDIVDDYNTKIYIRTFNHTATYFIGMLTAHLVLKYKDVKLPKIHQVLGWILALGGSLSAVYGLYGPADSVVVRSFYIGFHRIGWTFGVGWLAYSCITGNAGIINRILSWKVFVPLGNLSYLVYLIHPLVILYRNATLRERVYYGHTELVFEYLAYTVISFFLAFIGYVTVEMPFTFLEKIIFKRKSTVTLKSPNFPKEVSSVKVCGVKNLA